MTHPKFIITSGGHLRLGMVTLHRDLLMGHEQCLGGGFYEFDYASNKLILSGKSFDYGQPRWSKINVLLLPEAYRDIDIIYRDSRGDEFSLNAVFKVEFYSD